ACGVNVGGGRWRIAGQPVDGCLADERIDARLLIEGKERAGGEVAVGGHAVRRRQGASVPDSEVRSIVLHACLRTSESKDTSNSLIQCGFGSEVRIWDSPRE